MPRTITPKSPNKLAALLRFDREQLKSRESGCCLIGLDEVGRGSLIGPVVAAAVCFPASLSREQKELLAALDDSKKLTAAVRASLYEAILGCCQVGIGEAGKEEVDTLNVYHASLLASYRAYEALKQDAAEASGELLLLDGKALMPYLPKDRQRAIVKGDGKSAAIAAASVIAKHHRDSWVVALAEQYPGYGWESNMGYGTPEHLAAIERQGLTPYHRVRFRAVQEQLSLPLGNL